MSRMDPNQLAMLAGGIFVLIAALVCLFKRYSPALIITLVVLAIVMIGFPRVTSFKVGGAEVELGASLEANEKNPNDPATQLQVKKALDQFKSLKPANASPQLAEQIARGNEILGKTDLAVTWAQAATKKDPSSAKARELLHRLQVQKLTPESLVRPVTPQEASNLTSAISELSKHSTLTPESKVTLSKAQLILGQQEEAAANLRSALKEKPKLAEDPKVRALMSATPP